MLLVFHSERFFLRQYIKGYALVLTISFIVACFSLISLIHFELILYKEKNLSQFHSSTGTIQFGQNHFLNRLFFFPLHAFISFFQRLFE